VIIVRGKSHYTKGSCLPSGFGVGDWICKHQLVLKVNCGPELDGPDRRYLSDGVRAGMGTRRTGSEWRQDAAAERDLGPLW
jgi:hypothetical protein